MNGWMSWWYDRLDGEVREEQVIRSVDRSRILSGCRRGVVRR